MKNPSLWQNYANFAEARGQLVQYILNQYGSLTDKKVLDLGCGVGGTAFVLASAGAKVIALDVVNRLTFQHPQMNFKLMSANRIELDDEQFDIVIMQDVLEHLTDLDRVFSDIQRLLAADGKLFISTPNRLSPLNFVSDPHWNLPFVSLLPRKGVVFLVNKIFRKDTRDRNDWAALCSLFKLKKLLGDHHFRFQFHNAEAAQLMFENPRSVVCSPFHLRVISYVRRMKKERLIQRLVNNNFGLFNYFINPTWYIVGVKY